LLHADARNTFNRWNVFAFKAREHGGGGIDASKTQAEEADLQRQGGWPLEPEMKRGKERRRRRRREKDSRVAKTDLQLN
jgi:hypothetical protein